MALSQYETFRELVADHQRLLAIEERWREVKGLPPSEAMTRLAEVLDPPEPAVADDVRERVRLALEHGRRHAADVAVRERAGERTEAPMFGSPQDAAIFLARSLGRVVDLYLANRDEFERRVERDRLAYREAHYQKQWDEAVRVLREHHAARPA